MNWQDQFHVKASQLRNWKGLLQKTYTRSIQLTEIKNEATSFALASRDECVCLCENTCVCVCVSLVDTCGAIMTAPVHLCLRIARGYQSVLVRYAAGKNYGEEEGRATSSSFCLHCRLGQKTNMDTQARLLMHILAHTLTM